MAMANPTEIVDVTLSLDTSAYGSGDLLADTQVATNALGHDFRAGIIATATIIDKDDQGAAFDIYILDANVTMGTENSAPGISDANAASIMGKIPVATSDYTDLGGAKVAFINQLAIPVHAIPGTSDIAIAVVNGSGTPTYSAAGVVVRLGILRDQRMS